jgi:hypothetical protein
MSDHAVIFGQGISELHIAHVIASTGQQPRALKLITAGPTTDSKLLGKGTATLYLCAHGTEKKMGGMDPGQLLVELWSKGLDSSKYNTFFLFSCSTAAHVAAVQGYDGKTFAVTFYDAMQKNTVFKGITVKAFMGLLQFDTKPGSGLNSAPTVTREYVLLPNGEKRSVELATVVLSPSGGSYVPVIPSL